MQKIIQRALKIWQPDMSKPFHKIILWIAMASFAALFVYIFGQVYDRPRANEYFAPKTTSMTEPLMEGDVLSQQITFPFDRIRSLWLYFGEAKTEHSVMYVVTLYDESGEIVMQNDFKTNENSSPVNILLAPISGVKGKTHTLTIALGRTTFQNAAPFVFMEQQDFALPAMLNDNVLENSLAIQLNTPPNNNNTFMFLLVLTALMLACVIFLLGKNIVWNTVLMVLAFGIFIAILNPIGDVPDEYAHFVRAEALSQGAVFSSATSTLESDITLRAFMQMGNSQKNTFARFSDAALYAERAGQGSEVVQVGSAGNYFFLGYLASALGVLIGKAFSLPAMVCLYLCRILNVIYYAILCGAAVALAPRFRHIFSFVACLPMCLFVAASFNPDGITIGLVLLSIAVLVRLTQSENGKVELWHIAIWTALTTCAALTRIAYLGLLGLVFLIPVACCRKPNTRRWVCLQLLIAVCVAGLWTYFSGLQGLRAIDGANAGQQLAFLAQNFPKGMQILFSSLINEIYILFQGMFLLGWQTYNISWVGVLIPLMLMQLAKSEQPLKTPLRNGFRTAMGVAILVYFVTYLGMYVTSNIVGTPIILGVQGRYFLELFALTPLFFASFAREKKIWQYTYAAYSCFLFSVIDATMIVRHYL